jgi:hypothetical protein
MLLLLRHANRAFTDLPVTPELAFTVRLVDRTIVKEPVALADVVTMPEEKQIDNGRMPVLEGLVADAAGNFYAAHHRAQAEQALPPGRPGPGDTDWLPWGQLVFDYFTALPLSNPGPYFGDPNLLGNPAAQPQVDLDGLRVHGRINLNAAPWKVLSGLPFVPMQKIPVAWRPQVRRALGFLKSTTPDWQNPMPADFEVMDNEAANIGEQLAQAIVAYRELRPLPGGIDNSTGDYNSGAPAPPPPANAYARGWTALKPVARRGTGFMSVGELANVRHNGAALFTATPPPPQWYPRSFFRIDGGFLDEDPANNNTENFVEAAAVLIALGDWTTVRSQVFTVYGVLRGEADSSIVDPNPGRPPTLEQLQAKDVDSRALRFQETIDRLPTILGEPVPQRLGPRTLGRYTDTQND